ncbi:MAG: hypothetical protein ACR2Q3_05475 [Woeseiaceae bacterium]
MRNQKLCLQVPNYHKAAPASTFFPLLRDVIVEADIASITSGADGGSTDAAPQLATDAAQRCAQIRVGVLSSNFGITSPSDTPLRTGIGEKH